MSGFDDNVSALANAFTYMLKLMVVTILLSGCQRPSQPVGSKFEDEVASSADNVAAKDSISGSASLKSTDSQRTNVESDSAASQRYGSDHSASLTDPTTLRLATWNVNYANRNVDDLVATLRSVSADVVCLQETTVDMESRIRTLLAKEYMFIESFGHRGAFYAERFTVLSRLPVLNASFHPPVGTYFGNVTLDMVFDAEPVKIAGVHLAPFTSRGATDLLQLMSAINVAETEHKMEIESAVSHIPAGSPCVIMGDFNSLSTFVAPKTLMELGFIDSFSATHSAPDSHATWRWRFPNGLTAQFRIDYIFHSSHFKTVSSAVISVETSDHHLLLTELKRIDMSRDRHLAR